MKAIAGDFGTGKGFESIFIFVVSCSGGEGGELASGEHTEDNNGPFVRRCCVFFVTWSIASVAALEQELVDSRI